MEIRNEFNGKAFGTLSRYLKECVNHLKRDDLLNDALNNTSVMNVIMKKLPDILYPLMVAPQGQDNKRAYPTTSLVGIHCRRNPGNRSRQIRTDIRQV